MTKIAALQGFANTFQKRNKHGSPRKRNRKRQADWVDVSDDDMHVKSAKRQHSSYRNAHLSDSGPRKKPRLSAPGALGSVPKQSLELQRKQLPIHAGRDAVIDIVRQNEVTILVGETGSGKTTQVPQYLLEAGLANDGMIAITQPRKVAATSLASRVAAEKHTTVGALVGYSVRFDEASSSQTRIKYLTDGMIIRELLGDPLLSRYSIIIVDEAHERTLRTDLLLANLKTIQRARNTSSTSYAGKGKARESSGKPAPLKIVIMSATLEADKFSNFFGGAKVVYVKGRQHPVTTYHTAVSQPDYVDAALRTFFQIHTSYPEGDVLVFLPGQEDIDSLEKSIQLYTNQLPKEVAGVLVCPMYAALPPSQQVKIFATTPSGMRKCILATNIAETSITIPGVKYVVDTGKCKERRYVAKNLGAGFDTLLPRNITQSSAIQRAGRAGREGRGYCFRLYTEEAFKTMPAVAEPEIRRVTLTSSFLQLKCLNQDIQRLDFMDPPEPYMVVSALKTLFLLGALDEHRELTPIGRKMAMFPLEPHHARALLAAAEFGCTAEILAIVSVFSASSSLFVDTPDAREAAADARRKFRHVSGDHMTALNAVRAYEDVARTEGKAGRREWCRKMFLNERCLGEAADIRAQLRDVCTRMGMDCKTSVGQEPDGGEGAVLRALVRGLTNNTAALQADGSYRQVMGSVIVKIHPSSSLADKKVPLIIYDELTYTTHFYARGVSSVPRSFLGDNPVLLRRTV